MRVLLFTVLATIGLVGSALAEPMATVASVDVTLSPELRKKAVEEYGVRDVERLAGDLRKEVAQEMEKTGVLAGGRLELVLVDAQPNRPTFKQLGDRPGLSLHSFGVGGATIDRDPAMEGRLKVVFVPDYSVSNAERHIPGTDVS